MPALDGMSALVTGGYGGFGKACAIELARDGASVVLMGRRDDSLATARELVRAAVDGARIGTCVGDATIEADVEHAVRSTVEFGQGIDIVISTVGGVRSIGPIGTHAYTDFLDELAMNVGSAFLAVQNAAPHMSRGGSFVFISSTAAVMPFPSLSGYCAGKAGLEQFLRSAANELGPMGVRLNAVRPGLTHTDGADAAFANEAYVATFIPKIPLGRTGVPLDVAAAVRFLAGPESSWITGQSFAVDGGHELRGPPDQFQSSSSTSVGPPDRS
jgi:NAD(P)-dependent dehydrogenase (short-subunit alcohol dehydrogenase family)